jgi:hypothetical protein
MHKNYSNNHEVIKARYEVGQVYYI